jgi:Uma2 family endonuclease
MRVQHPIIERQTKPASEWICGRVVRKVSPRERHSRAQTRIAIALTNWADAFGTGRVGTEWEFRIAPAGEVRRTLVPDVAYLSYDRIPYEDDDAADMPEIAPNIAIEILSPRDRRAYIEEKIRVYLACGTEAVMLVDPQKETVEIHDAAAIQTLYASQMLTHPALPHFSIPVAQIFAKPKPRAN